MGHNKPDRWERQRRKQDARRGHQRQIQMQWDNLPLRRRYPSTGPLAVSASREPKEYSLTDITIAVDRVLFEIEAGEFRWREELSIDEEPSLGLWVDGGVVEISCEFWGYLFLERVTQSDMAVSGSPLSGVRCGMKRLLGRLKSERPKMVRVERADDSPPWEGPNLFVGD